MIEDDFYFDNDGTIKHFEGETDTYTVLELHRYLQELADRPVDFNSNTPNDFTIDITSPSPSMRITDHMIRLSKGINIDDETAKFLKDGSIIQDYKEIWTSEIKEDI